MTSLKDRTVLVVGRGSGIARAVTLAARAAGATVVVAGRDEAALAGAYDDPDVTAAAARAATSPARRVGRPEEIAEAVVFALGSSFLTGVSLGVDGGEPLV
jgi:NAD(P)-dependent dehydrogenase (short-subunit alcohol dehydrogenase family)